MLHYPQRLEISRLWKTPTSWIAESSEARRPLLHQLRKGELWGWALAIGEVNRQQMAMGDLEMEITTDIVNKMAVATHLTAVIATGSLHHHRKRSVDEHGNDTAKTDQIQDCHLDLRKQIIQPMMEQGSVQMAIDPGLVISTVIGLLQETELAHHRSTRISQATGQTAEDETIALQGTIDLRENEMIAFRETIDLQEMIDFQEKEMTALEDAMTEMSAVTRTEIESGTGTGSITMSAVEADEPEVAVAAQFVIASETESGRENLWRELMIGIETCIVDEYGQMIRGCSPCFGGSLGRRERDLRLAFDCNGMVGSGLGWSCLLFARR
jgi:hypothetical protein